MPPMPVLELTMEQQFRLRQVEDLVQVASKDDLVIVFMALQRQCMVLQNNVMNLVNNWNTPTTTPEGLLKSGTLSETKDSTTT